MSSITTQPRHLSSNLWKTERTGKIFQERQDEARQKSRGRIVSHGIRVFEGYNRKEPKITNNPWLTLGEPFTKQKCQELGIRQKSPPQAAQRFRGEAQRGEQ